MGIWEQTVGAMRKGSQNKTEKVAETLNALVARGQFERDLGDEVARRLRSQAGEGVTRTEEPISFGVAGLAEAGGKSSTQPEGGVSDKTALELQVLSTRLVGKHRNSGSQALAVEIQATLIRTCDGQELYSCPIRYRGKSRKLKSWTEADAKLLREELNACSQATAQMLAGELIRRGLVSPKLKSGPVVPEHL
jgi:hypothetical protein